MTPATGRPCIAPGCVNKTRHLGLCDTHYDLARLTRKGHPREERWTVSCHTRGCPNGPAGPWQIIASTAEIAFICTHCARPMRIAHGWPAEVPVPHPTAARPAPGFSPAAPGPGTTDVHGASGLPLRDYP